MEIHLILPTLEHNIHNHIFENSSYIYIHIERWKLLAGYLREQMGRSQRHKTPTYVACTYRVRCSRRSYWDPGNRRLLLYASEPTEAAGKRGFRKTQRVCVPPCPQLSTTTRGLICYQCLRSYGVNARYVI